MNGKHFWEWFEDLLIPAVKGTSLTVLDNAPCYNTRRPDSIHPTTVWKNLKEDIQQWLTDKGMYGMIISFII